MTLAPDVGLGAGRPAAWALSADELRALSRPSAWRTWRHVADTWGLIVAAVTLSVWASHPAAYLAAVVVVGTRQHSLGVHAHDAAHGLLFRSRPLNDLVGELLLAWPIFTSLAGYRLLHLPHHRYLNTDRDPDWYRNGPERLHEPGSWTSTVALLLGFRLRTTDLGVQFGMRGSDGITGWRRRARPWVYAAAAVAVTAAGAWAFVVAYWIVPFVTCFLPAMRIRGISDHWAVASDHPLRCMRTVRANLLERFLLFPKGVNFHIEHHLYPTVPFYRLAALHRRLMQSESYAREAHVTHGVTGLALDVWRAHQKAQPVRPVA